MKKIYIQPDARCINTPEPLMQSIQTGSDHETEAKETSGIFEEQEAETSSNAESSLWDSNPGNSGHWGDEDD